jgi:DNA-binding winged helix-turn-helix (wHTH) protein/Tol biopolymer transport system component
MSNQGKHFYEFGPFRVDPDQRLLWRGREPVPLRPKAFETLLVLVQHGEGVVLKDDFINIIWPDTIVEESNLAQTIFVLRKALGDIGAEQRYIVTVPGRGYRFAEKVRMVPAGEESEELLVESHSRSRVVIEEEPLAVRTPGVAPDRRLVRRYLLLGGAALALMAAVLVFRRVESPPRVLRIRQITHLGNLLPNVKLFTDGPRVYFRAWDREGKDRTIGYVSTEGGEVFTVEKALPQMDIEDISRSGSEFLVADLGSGEPHRLWRVPAPSGSPQPVAEVRAEDSTWSPEGDRIAYSVGSDLYLVNSDGSNSTKIASLSGQPIYLRWSPDGRQLRFSVRDWSGAGIALWQADFPGNAVRPMVPDWDGSHRALAGGSTLDGRYFFYTAMGEGTRDVWVIRERDGLLRQINSRPVQLTDGPLAFYQPTPSKDGKSVFAVGEQVRGQLLRYDAASRQFVPYAQGISADHVAFSHDAQWMAYVELPEGVLVRSRVDGSERRQLTFTPMRVYNPQWSPDGTRLAIEASAKPGTATKIYLVPRDGGATVLASAERRDRQVYPSWSAQGNSILFSSFNENDSNSALWMLDLRSGDASLLPNSGGLWYGQISPDGRQVVALAGEARKLTLYDILSNSTRALADSADYPRWSADGEYVYFRTYYFFAGVENPGIYRWHASTNTIEKIVDAPDFPMCGAWGIWSGFTPDGAPLVVRDLGTRDLYRLDVELP